MSNSRVSAQRILVVEDDKPIADMLTMMLEMEGYGVDWAPSARAAMHYLTDQVVAQAVPSGAKRTHGHALILLDLQLPDMDGSDLVRQLTNEGVAIPPVIVLSAKREQAVYDAATRINAVGVLTKPFQLDTLLHEIHQSLG
jgi:DNA-binding response OmpR family regulator